MIKTKRIKSIYEASVAYGREHRGTVNIENFEAGANYVLEQIESFPNKTIDVYNLIEQLKK